MDEEELETPAVEENEEEIELDLGDDSAGEEESAEDLKAKLEAAEQARQKAEKAFEDQKRRAELAEKKANKPEKKPEGELSSMEMYALMKADVPEEDIQEVVDYAKMKGMTVKDALATNVVKTILSDAAEKRRTAEATSTGASRRTAPKVSTETLLNNARNGKMPESEDAIAALINARLESK